MAPSVEAARSGLGSALDEDERQVELAVERRHQEWAGAVRAHLIQVRAAAREGHRGFDMALAGGVQ